MKNVKFVKKALAMVLAAAMSLSLAACGSGAASSASAASTAGSTPAAPAAEEKNSQVEFSAIDTPAAAEGTVYKVGIVKYVDDASLDQIESAIQAELDAKGQELGVTFDYADYTKNGQADSTTLNQIASDLVADNVDVIIPIATPAALIMQTATEENQIPVVFSAVSDPVSAGLVNSLDAPGSNVTGTSDALNVEAIIDLMLAANPDLKKLGLLYDQGQDSSKSAIASAEAYCKEKGIEASRAYVSAVLSFPSSTASSYLEVELLDSDGSKAADVGVAYSLDYGTCTVVPLESLTGGSEKPERIERGGDAL